MPRSCCSCALALAIGLGCTPLGALAVAHAPLEEIVVTAARTVRPLEVVTDPGKPRQPLPAHDGADYLKTIAGFSIIRKGGSDGDPVFRGMAGSRVNIISDDAMLLGGCGQRMDPPTAYVFPQNYDQIRVLKGPQSVRYGAGGSAATVLFEREPYTPDTEVTRISASALTGSWGRRDLAADALSGTGLGYLRLQGSDARSEDYQDGAGVDVHSEYHRQSGGATLGFTPSDHTLVELSGTRSDGEAAYADRAMDGTKFAREAFSLRIRQRELSPRVEAIDVNLAYGYVDHVMDNYSLRTFTPSMMMRNPSASNPDRETLAGYLHGTLKISDALEAVIGIDGHDDQHSTRSSMNQPAMSYQAMDRVTDARFAQRGIFGEFTRSLGPAHELSWGLRLDQWQVEDKRDTVRVGMMAVPNVTRGQTDNDTLSSGYVRYEHALDMRLDSGTAGLVLFSGLGYAERVADYWERFGNGNQSPTSVSAFFTDPERTLQFDVGALREGSRGRLSVSLFASRIDDYVLIDLRAKGKPAGSVVTRSIEAHTIGGELEYGVELAAGTRLESTVAYTHGENRTDNRPLGQMPPLEVRVSLDRSMGPLAFGALMRWTSDQQRVDLGRGNIAGQDFAESDGFTVFSLNASYALSESLGLSAGIDNLFDAQYDEHLSRSGAAVAGFTQIDRIAEPGRTLWLKLDASL